jgi:hypothetical protein
MLNVFNMRGSKFYVQCSVCVDLVANAIDGSTGSDVQDQLRDSDRNFFGFDDLKWNYSK